MSPRSHARRIAAGCVVAVSATLLTFAGASTASAEPADDAVTPCPAVEVISVRGSGADRNSNDSLSYVQAQRVKNQSTQNVRVVDLRYPALVFEEVGEAEYNRSVREGVANLRARLDRLNTNCPGIKVAVVGYSQGAQVFGNALDNQPVSGGNRIKAGVMFGDPKFNNRAVYDAGSYTQNNGAFNGVFGARPLGALSDFADRLRSFCRFDDNVCQSGSNGDGHTKYEANATDFILSKIGG